MTLPETRSSRVCPAPSLLCVITCPRALLACWWWSPDLSRRPPSRVHLKPLRQQVFILFACDVLSLGFSRPLLSLRSLPAPEHAQTLLFLHSIPTLPQASHVPNFKNSDEGEGSSSKIFRGASGSHGVLLLAGRASPLFCLAVFLLCSASFPTTRCSWEKIKLWRHGLVCICIVDIF